MPVELIRVWFGDGDMTFERALTVGKELAKMYPVWRDFRFVRVNVPAYTDDPGRRDNYWKIYAGFRAAGFMFDYLSMANEPFDDEHVGNARDVVLVDIDGTLIDSRWDGEGFKVVGVNRKMVEHVNGLYDEGHLIIVYTGRSSVFYELTYEQLKSIGLKFDGVIFDKPFADLIIDDAPVVHPGEIKK